MLTTNHEAPAPGVPSLSADAGVPSAGFNIAALEESDDHGATTVRVGKREIISRTAGRSGLPIQVVTSVYTALVEALVAAVADDETVILPGFGRFYRQDHKGHQVRFGQTAIDDYPVLKFSASRGLNRTLDQRSSDRAGAPMFAARQPPGADLPEPAA